MKIKVNIDTKGYTSKPSEDGGAISNRTRCAAGQQTIEPAGLLKFIERGYTFTPACIGGTLEEQKANQDAGGGLDNFWISQQVIAIDIDNTHKETYFDEKGKSRTKTKINARELTPAEALQACRDAGIDPYCIYKSFSYTPEHEKYRVLFILDKPLTSFEAAADLIARCNELFDTANENACKAEGKNPETCTDKSIVPTYMIFGGRKGCIIYKSEPESITSIEALQALPPARPKEDTPRTCENAPKNASNQKTVSDTKNTSAATSAAYHDRLEQLEATLEHDKANFDILSYIERTTESRKHRGYINPCPICGHNKCLSLEPSGAAWCCHSDAHGMNAEMIHKGMKKPGGGIIDYLMQKHDISMHDAFDMFKFDIMQYSREEWKTAYKERKNAEAAAELPSIEQMIEDFNNTPDGKIKAESVTDPGEIQEDPAEDPGAVPHKLAEPGTAENTAGRSSNNESGNDAADPGKKTTPANGSGAPMPEKLINATEYITSLYDADIEELQQYAGRKMNLHPGIDKYLTLYPGLAVLGGQASLGKTTFCVNMAAKLLERGEHVLYFSLEQKPDEIITKAAARYIHEHTNYNVDNFMLNSGARDPQIENALAGLALELKHFSIIACDFETTAARILATIEQYMLKYQVKPIVIIDYLQIIAPPENFKGAKGDYIDENLKTLKKWQKNHGLFILLVSSFNRANNYEPVSYESFLYTSAIEFTCDYVFGLQLALLDPDNDDYYTRIGSQGGISERTSHEKKKLAQKAQSEMPKKVQFVSLKNRKGKQLFKANFDYYPAHDRFIPAKEPHTTPKAGKK